MVYKNGLMVLFMKANGTKTKLKEKVLFGMLRVIYMLEILELIKLTVLVFTLM
jgi:hypothetical protein